MSASALKVNVRRAAQIRRQAVLGVLCQLPESEHRQDDVLMLEQGPPASVQAADRGQLRWRQVELLLGPSRSVQLVPAQRVMGEHEMLWGERRG